MTKEQAIEQLKDLKAVYSGAVQAGEISIANMIKGGIDLIEKLQKENEELKDYNKHQWKERRRLTCKLKNSIPVQKVKDKIEEIEQEYFKILSNKTLSLEIQNINAHKHDAMKTVLQELLESED